MPPSLKEEVSDEKIASLPLSKIWPSDAHESIEDDAAAALVFAARQEIPAKPRVPSRVRAWVSKVKTYRTLVKDLGKNSLERIEQLSKEKGFHSLVPFFAKVRLLSQLPRETWSRVERVEEYPNAIRYEKDGSKTAVAFSSVTIDGKSHRFEGVGKIGPDEVQKVKEMLGTAAPKKGGLTPADFEVRGTAKTGYKINRKGDSEYRSLKIFTGEDAAKKALAWRDEHTADLEAAWEAVKARDNVSKAEVRRDENRERTGENRRNGRDVTAEMFTDAFGFRGGQFGNWVGQGSDAKSRQGMLNDAYDALLDLSDILGIPSRAISLNGTLGLSFGARGSGKAAAHFEPSNLVINLTKTRGAGSLAHEWFHALDNYFSRMRGGEVAFTGDNNAYRQNNFVTYKPEAAWGKAPITPYTNFMRGGQLRERLRRLPGFTYDANKTLAENAKAAGFERDPNHKDGVRPQVEKAFADLVQALNESPMAKRASSLDKAADGYWGRIIERGARSFENYVISKMAQRGWSNDFLANIRSFDEWMAMGKNAERYPYLKPEEDAPVVDAFDKLFETVETRETEGGNVAMFSRTPAWREKASAGLPLFRKGADQTTGLTPTQFTQALSEAFGAKVADRLQAKGVVVPLADQNSLPAHVVPYLRAGDVVFGFYDPRTDRTYAVLENLTPDMVKGLALHEVGVHYGFEAMLGADKYKQVMKRLDGMHKLGSKAVRAARAEAVKNAARPAQVPEETLAYLVQNSPELGLIKEVIAKIKAFLFREFGIGGKYLTEADLHMLAKAAVQHAARTEPGGVEVPAFMREPEFSRSPQTETKAFKDWFGDSKVVDADGKPLVVYHWTDNDFSVFDMNLSGEGAHFGTKKASTDRARGMAGIGYEIEEEEGQYFVVADSGPKADEWQGPFATKMEAISFRAQQPKKIEPMALYLSIKNPIRLPDLGTWGVWDIVRALPNGTLSDAEKSAIMAAENRYAKLRKTLLDKGLDGVVYRNEVEDKGNDSYIAFSPNQIKSATGNNGNFDPANPDIRFSRAADLRKEAAGQVVELFHTATNVPGRLNWWHKTVGTMYNLAQRSPEFKRVFSAVQDFIDDTAYYADRAARLAPNILPKLETWRDVFKSPMSAIDNRAIRAPIFEGTLTWMRDESGKPVKAEDVRLAAEDLTTDQKALRLLRNDFVTDSTLRMWRGLPMEQYEAIIEGSYERHMLRAGIVFTPDELKSLFKLTDGQVKLYQEFRRATDMSLTNLAISEMVKLGGEDVASMQQAALDSEDVVKASAMLRDHLLELADADAEKSKGYIDAANKIIALSDKAKNLMDKGYAPLSRFGHYTVDVVGPDGTREYFGMFESRFEAAKMAEAMAKNYPDARIERGTVSEQAYKLFAGVTPETIELFGEILGLDTQGDGTQNQAFKAFVQRATANRSAMKRLLERKGIAGFSEDAGRVLAGFVFSNGRRTAGNLHGMEMKEAAEAIPKQQGELKDHAVALVEYVQNPQEEAQGLRGLLFTQYIGGSIASAIVNMTQPLTMSLPYLSQFGGITQAGRQMARAVKDVGKTTTGDKALDAAMTAAEEKGIVSPQEVHQLQQQAAGRAALQVGDGTMAGDARAKAGNALSKTMLAWGKLFSAAEQFNRRVTFIAAYRTAVEQKIENPAKFAEDAVIETQGLYNKGNKPKWARGAIGSTLFTFKQYSVAYVEMLGRLAQSGPEGRRAALYALAILFMLSGAGGMPGADDLDDLISGLMQKLGYNFNSKSARRAFFAKHLGQAGSDFVERGVSGIAGVPIDISGRMGLGNLIPGTGLMTKKTDHTSDVAELAGPAGDLAKRAFQAGSKAMDGDLIGKDGAVNTIAPLAVRNLSQAADMAEHGMYRDARGRKVVETDQLDALSKAFGFQPNDVKRVQDATREVQQMISLNKIRETEIADQWAKALFERDKGGVQEARDALKRWNADNPESPIRISMQQINKRLANMRMSKEDRMAKTASKEIRATVRRELEAAR